jgi:hypothetical protein
VISKKKIDYIIETNHNENINHLILKIKQHYTCPISLQGNIQVMKELLDITPIHIWSFDPRPYG